VLVAAPSAVSAQETVPAPELVALRWEGFGESEGCLGVPSLIARVEDHLGRRAFDASSPQVLSVSVDGSASSGFRAVVRVLDATGKVLGERELGAQGSTCSALDDTLVLAVALLVDAELGAEPEPEPEPVPPPPAPPPPPPEEAEHEKVPEEEAPPPDPWRIALDGSALGADGVLPSLAIGAELALQVDAPWLFPFRVRTLGFFPQSVPLEPSGDLDFWLFFAGIAGCPLSVRTETFGIDGCAGGDVVALRGVSEGLSGARDHISWFLQGAVSLRFLADLHGPWYGVLSTSVGLPIDAPRFVYRRFSETVPVFRMSEATLTAGLGVGVRLTP
jgi:hypothetical protein